MTFPYIKSELNMVAHNKKWFFFLNELNKSQHISLLGNCLQTKGFIVHKSSKDADTLILNVLLNWFLLEITDDSDLLVLLMHYF